jgi:hypothetical protein
MSDEMRSAELYGTAKKITNDLEDLPLHSHGAMIQLLNIAYEHRRLGAQHAEKLRQDALEERQTAVQEQMIRSRQEQQQKADAENLMKNAVAQETTQ